MAAQAATAYDNRPLRELIRPEIETPLPLTHVSVERRQQKRYHRCLLGSMTVGEERFPIACVDVSYGGAQVVTPASTTLSPGDRVTVHINHGPRSFRDDFRIVQSDRIATGTALHLSL